MAKKEEKETKDGEIKYQMLTFGHDPYDVPKMKVKKKSGTQYIGYGDDNAYPQFLDGLLNNSEHNAIVSSKVDYIAGEGFNIDLLSAEQKKWFELNDMESLLQKIALDYELYGGFAFYVIKTKDFENIAKLEYADFGKIRVNADEDAFLIGENWEKYRTETVEIQPYKKDTDIAKTLFYYKGPTTKEVYPLPKYYGAIPSIQTGIEIDNFHLNHVKNGFFIPTIFSFNNGIPSQEAQEEMERDLQEKFTGSGKAGKFLLTFNDNKENAVEIETLEPAELDKKFEVLAEQVQQKVLSGHRVTSPMLFGIKTEGQLGGRTELIEAYELFKNTYINPTQNTLEGVLTEVLSENWNDLEIELLKRKPIEDRVPDDQMFNVMDRNEIREAAGLPTEEATEEEKILMRLNQLPQPLLEAVIAKMTDEQLSKLSGINLTDNINEEENVEQ